ncbi:hypothetical protein LOD99_1737 [Oopsacas minuta]|uniref:Uncharacterized protein n=1 Tax=Oopsacas minuta TaxID=111878 RepID=A0AAV7K5D4_9METZ|nr:hypothetical protein LOD99_1737 [Oopsacas minuta]
MRLSHCRCVLFVFRNVPTFHIKKAHNSLWSYVEFKLHDYLKSDLHKEALLLFNRLRLECTPISPPLLQLIVVLYLEKGPQSAGLSHVLSYMRSTSLHPSSGLAPILINRALIKRDHVSLKYTLDSCFQNKVSVRPSSFTQAIQHLLTNVNDYECVYQYVCAYLDAGSNVEEQLLSSICEEHLFSQSPALVQSIMCILTHYKKQGKYICNKQVFESLANSLKLTNEFTHVKRTYLINDKCQACGSCITQTTFSPDTYSSLEQEVREEIQQMYINQRVINSPEMYRIDNQVDKLILSISNTSDRAMAVVVDCLSAATAIDTGWSETVSERINCNTLLQLVESIERDFNPSCVVLLIRRVLLWRNENEIEMEELRARASVIVINKNSIHSLFSLLIALRLKSRALLLTADTFNDFKLNFSPGLYSAITSWFLRHSLRFDITGIEPIIYKSSQTLWQLDFSSEGLHVPMRSNEWICAKK